MSRPEDSDADRLAQAIAQLSPLQVHVTKTAAVVQMVGGGPMYHEGIGIILTEATRLPAGLEKQRRRLHAQIPAFLYRLYDSRIFLDRCELTGGEQPASAYALPREAQLERYMTFL